MAFWFGGASLFIHTPHLARPAGYDSVKLLQAVNTQKGWQVGIPDHSRFVGAEKALPGSILQANGNADFLICMLTAGAYTAYGPPLRKVFNVRFVAFVVRPPSCVHCPTITT